MLQIVIFFDVEDLKHMLVIAQKRCCDLGEIIIFHVEHRIAHIQVIIIILKQNDRDTIDCGLAHACCSVLKLVG